MFGNTLVVTVDQQVQEGSHRRGPTGGVPQEKTVKELIESSTAQQTRKREDRRV